MNCIDIVCVPFLFFFFFLVWLGIYTLHSLKLGTDYEMFYSNPLESIKDNIRWPLSIELPVIFQFIVTLSHIACMSKDCMVKEFINQKHSIHYTELYFFVRLVIRRTKSPKLLHEGCWFKIFLRFLLFGLLTTSLILK